MGVSSRIYQVIAWLCAAALGGLPAPVRAEEHLSLAEYQKRPFCNPSSPVPPVKGYMSQDNLVLDAGCRYAPFESPGAAACLSGTWMVIMGSSNTLLEFNNLINFLAPDEYFIDRTGELIGVSSVVDMTIRNKKVIHWTSISAKEDDCEQLNLDEADELRPKCASRMSALFAEAPGHQPDVIRITFITSFFWYRASLALDMVEADAKWKDAKVAVVAQIGAWYMYCMIIKFKFCPRKELIPVDFYKKGLQIYAEETKTALNKMEDFCKSGRASALGCYVQTISWSNGARDKKAYAAMNVPLKKDMLWRASPKFRLVDFFALGGVMPKEVVEGHGSQLLNLWIWTVMFNGFCPAELGSLRPVARFAGTMCTASKLSYSKCPQYHKLCTYNTKHFGGPSCMNWACLNSVPCTLSTHDLGLHSKSESGKMCKMKISSRSFPLHAEWTASIPSEDFDPPAGDWTAVWLLPWFFPALLVLLAVLLKVIMLLTQSNRSAHVVALGEETEPLTSRVMFTVENTGSPPESFGPPTPPTSWALSALPSAENHFVLGLALFLAATHVALSEAFTWGRVQPWEFYGWGEMWVPFVIMVSGFLLMASEDAPPKEDHLLRFPGTFYFYPLYALGLLLTFTLAKLEGTPLDLGTLVAQAFLVQTWVPGLEDQLLPELRWVSCLAFYWLCFNFLAVAVQKLNLPSAVGLLSFLLLLPWFIILLLRSFSDAAFAERTMELSDLTLNLGGGLQAQHPLSYIHVFLVGILVARLRHLLDVVAKDAAPGVVWQNPYVLLPQLATLLGLLGLALVQSWQVFRVGEYQTFAVCKPLLPFQALILLGLVGLPSLPLPYVAYAFSYLDFLEDYWWPLLVTSPCVLAVWQAGEVSLFHVLLLVLLLYATTYLVANCIQKPLRRLWASSLVMVVLLPFLVAGVLVGCSLLLPEASPPEASASATSAQDVPGRSMQLLKAMPHGPSKVVKPAILVTEGEVMLLAQKQHVTWSRSCGVHQDAEGNVFQSVILEETIHSELVVGRQPLPHQGNPLKLFEVEKWHGLRTSEGEEWKNLCISEQWFPENRTLLRRIISGPENGKLVELGGSTAALVFESMPPKGSGSCPRRDVRATQVYFSAHQRDPAQRLDYGFFNGEEKNWIPFVHAGSLHFVYPPVPHVIVKANASGGRSQRLWQTEFLPLQRLKQSFPKIQFHGSAQAVLMDKDLPHPHYLALLHTVNPEDESAGRTHYAYRFAAEEPFEMLEVSAALPVAKTAAVSGLAVVHDTVLLTYTEDEESRALVLSLQDLNKLFACEA